jgi:PKD domain
MRDLAKSMALCLGLVLAACMVLAPLAGAEWLPPVNISEASEHTGSPHVVLDSEGNATAVWDRWNGVDTVVESAYRPAGESWGAPENLSEPELEGEIVPGANDAQSPQVAVDRNNNVTVLWERYAGTKLVLESVDRPAGGSWTAPVKVGEVNLGAAPEPWIAVDWEGRATAVWKDSGVIEAAFRPFGGSWETPVPLSPEESFTPQAAMDARGDTTVVWMHFDGSHYLVESAYRPEGASWETPTLVSQAGEDGGNPHVALDAAGDSLVAWQGEDEGEEFVRAAYRPVGGSWSAAADVSAEGEAVEAVRDAVDPQGNAIVAWSGDMGKAGEYRIAHAAFKPLGGSWQAPVGLSSDGGNAFPSDVVFDTSGNAALIWQRWDGTTDLIQASYRPAGEEWEPAVDLSEEGKQGMDPVVVLDAPGDSVAADGNATAVWISETAASCGGASCPSSVVQAAGYDPEGLPEVALEVPVEGTVGEPVEISTPTEALFAPLLEFGDGESVTDTEASHVYDEPGEYEVTLGGAEVLGYRASAQRTIAIAPAGNENEDEGEPEPEGKSEAELPGGGVGGTQAPTAVNPGAGTGQVTAAASPRCVAAMATRDAARRRLAVLRTAWDRAGGPSKAAHLLASKRAQAAVLRRARHRVAASC